MQLHHLCCPSGQYWWFNFILKGYDMKMIRSLIIATLIISTLLIMFICGAAIAGYVAPEFAFALLPYIGMVIILGIWYP